MKTRILNIALAAALSTAGMAQAADKQPRTLVKVNGKDVQETHFLVYRAQRGGPSQGKDLDKQAQVALLNELVNTIMIAQAGEKNGLADHPELKAAIDVARYRILAEATVEQYLRDNPVSDKDIEAAYNKKYGDNKLTEYKARHILVKTEADAKTLIGELDKGADFATLAKEKSTGPSGAKGGDLGWFEKSQMVKPFGDALATMKKGSHSDKPVMTQFGWHVIKLEDSRDQKPPELAAVRTEISQQLARHRAALYIKSIREQSDVQILGADGKPQKTN